MTLEGPGEGWDGLRAALLDRLAQGVEAPMEDEEFDRWAGRVLRYQLAHNEIYRRFSEARLGRLSDAEDWRKSPPVPTQAFKHLDLISGDPGAVERTFRTSGTTAQQRGRHHVLDLGLYRASALPNFRAHLLPDGRPLQVVSLIPSPEDRPDSSLSAMVGMVMESASARGGAWCADAEHRALLQPLREALGEAVAERRPVLVVGTAFAFVHVLEAMAAAGERVSLPPGSRVMETGGFKGRSREVTRAELYHALEDRLGVPIAWIVNEYGMTELLSQFYEAPPAPDSEAGGLADPSLERRFHRAPPWVRTRVLDPRTLEPTEPGQEGILCHFDLANLGSIAHVVTEDRGVAIEDGFRLLGRWTGAEPRGCSLAVEELRSSSYV